MENPLKLKKVHHVEFWVGNAKQASFFYRNGFGFSQVAYRGQETGARDATSYALAQGKAVFVLTTPLASSHPASDHLRKHGDGVRDIAFEVDDADAAFAEAVRRGAEPAWKPCDESDEFGTIRRAAVKTYGDTIHSLISYKDYRGPFLPGYREQKIAACDAGILRVDHMVGNVELGKMNDWADYYSRVFGFHRYISFDDKDISTEYSALMSIVMSDDSYSIKFPINVSRSIWRSGSAARRIAGEGCALHRRSPAAERNRIPARARRLLRHSARSGGRARRAVRGD